MTSRPDLTRSLSALIKSYRVGTGKDCYEAARGLGVSAETIIAWEEGAVPIPLKKLHSMIRSYSIDPLVFMEAIAAIQASSITPRKP